LTIARIREAELRGDGKVHPLHHPNFCVQQPGNPTFTGPIHNLINGYWCISARL
jgi:hypothetical protein